MDRQFLSDKELKFIRNQLKMHWYLYLFLIFILALGIFYYIYIFHIYEPRVEQLLQDKPRVKEFFETSNAIHLKPAFTFFFFLIGMIVGSIISQGKLSKILKKIVSQSQDIKRNEKKDIK